MVSAASASVSSGNPMMRLHFTRIPARTAAAIDVFMRPRSIFFLIRRSTLGEPLSGAYATLRQPEAKSSSTTSVSIASERVPAGICHVMPQRRSTSLRQKSTIQSLRMIAVRS